MCHGGKKMKKNSDLSEPLPANYYDFLFLTCQVPLLETAPFLFFVQQKTVTFMCHEKRKKKAFLSLTHQIIITFKNKNKNVTASGTSAIDLPFLCVNLGQQSDDVFSV